MKLNFILTVHNHQPVGNFDSVFEEVYQKAYKPFLDVLDKFPEIKITQHYTGILLEWLQNNHPEFIDRLRQAIKRNQIELLTGAYYEAILSVIPPEDRILQIQKLSNTIKQLFDYEPSGLWLAERVWEQTIAKEISQAGVKFLPLDDSHFIYAGINEKDLLGYYITEEQGHKIFVFPGDKKLRYIIPFSPVEETFNFLKSIAGIPNNLIVFADDGEKFGSWPGTYDYVYKQGWLEKFFSKILENKDWFNTIHFSEALKLIEPKGIIYLPTASYPEMLKWSLKPEFFEDYEHFENEMDNKGFSQYKIFLKGGYWRNFFSKYPEANWMHKRMLRVSNKLSKTKSKNIELATNHLLAAQCNDAYWHGVFGGLYLPNLRFPVYSNLIKAESLISKSSNYEIFDFDCDGKDEIIIETKIYNFYIKPEKGGAIFELDYKPANINLLDIINRQLEFSHKKLLNKIQSNTASNDEVKLSESLYYDTYRHGSLIEHFFNQDATPEKFYNGSYIELGNFVEGEYKYQIIRENNKFIIELSRNGFVNGSEIKIIKTIFIPDNSSEILINYKLINQTNNTLNLKFGVELLFNLLAGNAPDRYYSSDDEKLTDCALNSIGLVSDIEKLNIVDEWLRLKIGIYAKNLSEFWRVPLETISISESGFEKLYQGSIILAIWDIQLNDIWETILTQKITRI